MKRIPQIIAGLTPVLVLLSSLGCTPLVIYENQHIMPANSEQPAANVYFIRAVPAKPKGIADKPVTVKYRNQDLLVIPEGSYTLLRIKPGKGEITTHSQTFFTNKPNPIDVSRSRVYDFIAGKTYFIQIFRLDEEFRGIYYDPRPIPFNTAKKLAPELSPRGDARVAKIETLEVQSAKKAAGPLTPAYPEGLYPGAPYLLKGNPDYRSEQLKPEKQPESPNSN